MNPFHATDHALCQRHTSNHRLAVVCLGNSLRGDDGAARRLFDKLSPSARETVCLLDAGSYTTDLAEFVSGHTTCIIIDAVQPDCEYTYPIIADLDLSAGHEQSSRAVMPSSIHALSWMDELMLCGSECALPEAFVFFGIPACQTEWSTDLSQELQQRLPEFAAQLESLVLRLTHA